MGMLEFPASAVAAGWFIEVFDELKKRLFSAFNLMPA
ncbi:MAG: hypothetical protein RLZZ436_370 [Planctomycetota bacterium]|jgi:hypothetical protein